MFSQYFGQYLFNKGILSSQQLYEIFKYKEEVRVNLGTLAVTSGLMSAAQVEEVFEIQKELDAHFGEIAINKGYLTNYQVDQLLNSQKDLRVTLSQAITDKGYMSLGEIEEQLHNFYTQKDASYLSAADIKAIESNDIDAIVKTFLNFSQARDSAEWCYEYVSLLLRNSIRFIGEDPAIRRMGTGQKGSFKKLRAKQNSFWLVSQEIPAPINISVKLTMEESVLLEIVSRFSKKVNKDISATNSAAEVISRFFNMHNNLFLSACLNKNANKNANKNVNENYKNGYAKLNCPEVFKQNVPFSSAGYRIPIVYSFGEVDILIEILEYEDDTLES